MDKRSESQFDYDVKLKTGRDYKAMPEKPKPLGKLTEVSELIERGNNPISGDDNLVRDLNLRERRNIPAEKALGKDLSFLKANVGKAKDVAASAKAIKDARARYY